MFRMSKLIPFTENKVLLESINMKYQYKYRDNSWQVRSVIFERILLHYLHLT